MRKVFLLLLGMFLFLLVGCYNYSRGSQYGQLVDIQFFDLNNQEIEGEFKNIYRDVFFERNTVLKPLANHINKLNSPAPVELYYCAEMGSEADIIVRLKVFPKNTYEFYSLRINNAVLLVEDFEKVENIDEYTYLDYLYHVEEDNYEFTVTNLVLQKNEKKVNGSTWVEGRTFISGFYIKVKAETNPE